VGTEIVSPLPRAHKISRPFPMNPRSPISVLRPMTFTTELVAFCKVYEFPVEKSQFISIPYIVTIEAPSHRLGMMEFNIRVFFFEFSLFAIDLQGGMAVATGEHSLSHRRRSIFFNDCRGRRGEKKQQKQGGNCCVGDFHDRSVTFLLSQRLQISSFYFEK